MKKLILAGGSGFLGRALIHYFSGEYEIVILSRQTTSIPDARTVYWDAHHGGNWEEELNGAAALINLAGKNVSCRYNASNRAEILQSRVLSTQLLGAAIRRAAAPPPVWINLSTATIYRHAEDRDMDEETGEYHRDFSVLVAMAWEKAFFEADVSVRQVALRTGIVLGCSGGALPEWLRLVRRGLGGTEGPGSQFVSWIHQEDFAAAVRFAIENPHLSGIYNLTAPEPVTNAYFLRELRQKMGVPIGLPCPAWLLKIGTTLMGTEAELVLKSRRVVPRRLLANGFSFTYPHVTAALEQLLR